LWEFFVVPHLNHSIVLGMDFLKSNNIIVNCGNNTLEMNHMQRKPTTNFKSNSTHFADRSFDSIFSFPHNSSVIPSCTTKTEFTDAETETTNAKVIRLVESKFN